MGERRDVIRQIARAGAFVDPKLSERDVERLVTGARRRRARRATRRRAVFAAASVASMAIAGMFFLHRADHEQRREVGAVPQRAAPAATERIVRLADGSMAAPLDAESEIEVIEEHPDRVVLSLVHGRGRFEVTSRPKRTFVVRAGDVTVTVVGTAFTVERVADRIGVAVQRGTVRVDWSAGSAFVTAGQSAWYPPLGPTASAARAPATVAKPARGARAVAKPPSSPAARDDQAEATAALLIAADQARLAGRASEGAELLRKLLREHPDDPRAPLAAFTLGRLLLTELGRPAEAAAAFAQARRLSPNGAFAEDALAREVEALGKAGRAPEARARAEEYERLYPNGRRMPTVRTAGATK